MKHNQPSVYNFNAEQVGGAVNRYLQMFLMSSPIHVIFCVIYFMYVYNEVPVIAR